MLKVFFFVMIKYILLRNECEMKDIIQQVINRPDYKPMSIKDFIYLLALTKTSEKDELKEVLSQLSDEGEIFLNASNKYELYKEEDRDTKKGIYKAGKGNYGFVELDDELFEFDIFISGKNSKRAYDNDIVLVKIIKHALKGMNPEGKIVKIIKRASQTYIGVFHRSKNYGFVTVKDKTTESDIYIAQKKYK